MIRALSLMILALAMLPASAIARDPIIGVGNLLTDVRALEKVDGVMARGRVID